MCSTSYANENNFVLVGQNNSEEKPAFILQLFAEELDQYFQINENGEVYLKADKVIAIPKEALSHLANVNDLVNYSKENDETERVKCTNCGTKYWATTGNRHCPNCGRYN